MVECDPVASTPDRGGIPLTSRSVCNISDTMLDVRRFSCARAVRSSGYLQDSQRQAATHCAGGNAPLATMRRIDPSFRGRAMEASRTPRRLRPKLESGAREAHGRLLAPQCLRSRCSEQFFRQVPRGVGILRTHALGALGDETRARTTLDMVCARQCGTGPRRGFGNAPRFEMECRASPVACRRSCSFMDAVQLYHGKLPCLARRKSPHWQDRRSIGLWQTHCVELEKARRCVILHVFGVYDCVLENISRA